MTGLVPRDPFMLLLTVIAAIALVSFTFALASDLVRWVVSFAVPVVVVTR
ncbi:MAG: hypothetical protein R6U01_11955 [Halorubrum sp.]